MPCGKRLNAVRVARKPRWIGSRPRQNCGRTLPLVKISLVRETFPMPITLDQIIEETRQWPPEKVGELVERLNGDLHACEPQVEAVWQAETARRVEEIQSGKVQGIPGEEVSARVRKIVGR